MENMHCNFNTDMRDEEDVKLDGVKISECDHCRYLGSIIQKNGKADEDVHKIKSGWLKWRSATGVLCDHKIPRKVKGKFYRTAVRPAMLYDSDWCALKQ